MNKLQVISCIAPEQSESETGRSSVEILETGRSSEEILVGETVFLCIWCENGIPHLFFSNAPLPASNNFWTKVQLSTKSDAFLSTIILLSLLIFFQPTVRNF